jgi:hypothetical protein
MRHIHKPAIAPAAIREYLQNQTTVKQGLDYRSFHKLLVRKEAVAEANFAAS